MNSAIEGTPESPRRGGGRGGKLARTLLLCFLAVSVLPLAVAGFIVGRTTAAALSQDASSKLLAVAEMNANRIDAFFKDNITQLVVEAGRGHIRDMAQDFRLSFEASGLDLAQFVASPEWRALAEEYGKEAEFFESSFGFQDLFLIDQEGNILYALATEPDLGTNILTGRYSDTLFGRACQRAFQEDRPVFSDFERYEPSNDAPACFIVAVIHGENAEAIGLLALEVRQSEIDEVMQVRTGQGLTGETYLIGTDLRMRSNSRLAKEPTVLRDPVETKQTRAWVNAHAAPGSPLECRKEAPIGYLGYRGVPVLGTHRTIEIAGVRIGVIAEIEASEALGPVRKLRTIMLIIGGVALGVVLVISVALSRRITGPVTDVIRSLTSTSSEILAASQEQTATAKEQAASTQEINTTVEELAKSGTEIADRAKQVGTAAEAASSAGASGLEVVRQATQGMEAIQGQVEELAENIVVLSERTQAVGEIISTVNGIAEQSNLLALNASIEAVAAGEEGSRFSVVANEMKNLADQAKESTVQVRSILEEIQKGINTSVMLTEEAVKRVDTGKEQASMTEETMRELANATQESGQAFQQIVGGTSQQQIGIGQVTEGMKDVRQGAEQVSAGSAQLEEAAADLNALGEQLRELVER